MLNELIDLLFELLYPLLAGIGGIAIIILLAWLFCPEKIEKWAILFHKLAAYISEKHEKRYISKHIEFTINDQRKKLCKESSGILPYALEVKWVDADTIDSALKNENILVVKMKNHRNQSKNLALAVKEYVPNALIPTARKYVEPVLMKAIDYVASKIILEKETSAFSYFVDITKPELDKIPECKEYIEQLDKINEEGKLSRVLLSEYKKLGFLHPADPNPKIYKETLELESKVYTLSTKEPEEKVDLSLLGEYLKVAVVPVAKDITVEMHGIQPHVDFIRGSLQKGINTFYLVAAGRINIALAKEVLKKAEAQLNLKRTYEDEYDGVYKGKKMKMFVGILETK